MYSNLKIIILLLGVVVCAQGKHLVLFENDYTEVPPSELEQEKLRVEQVENDEETISGDSSQDSSSSVMIHDQLPQTEESPDSIEPTNMKKRQGFINPGSRCRQGYKWDNYYQKCRPIAPREQWPSRWSFG